MQQDLKRVLMETHGEPAVTRKALGFASRRKGPIRDVHALILD
jgi:hypothetical protein